MFISNDKFRIDDLQVKNLKLYQDPEGFCFGIDAVLLASFASKFIKNKDKVMDLCTGSGIIPLLVWAKANPNKIFGVEINEKTFNMANSSIKLNKLEEKITLLNLDINMIGKEYNQKFDCLTVNPPYTKNNGGLKNEIKDKMIARHEIFCTLEDIIKVSSILLKDKGKFFLIHKSSRIDEILLAMNKYKIAPKEIQFIHPKENEDSNLVLIYGLKNAGSFVKVLKPLIVYKKNGEYTKDVLEYYGEMKAWILT